MDVSVIIISHNHGEYLKKCLSFLIKNTKSLKTEIFLIINNSFDKKSIKEGKRYSKIKLIINKKPKGLSANLNQGIKQSKGDYILILNPDTIIIDKAIEKLINFMKKNPKVGITGPKLIFPNGKLQLSTRRFPNWKIFLLRRTPLRIFFNNSKIIKHHLGADLNHSKAQPVDWLLGACLMIRRKVIKDIGCFDEKYYLYCEDIDYCFRAWKKGWEVWYVPDSVIIHHHLAISDKNFFSVYNWYHFRSILRYFFKNILGIIK